MTIAVGLLGGALLGLRWRYVVLFPTTLIVGLILLSAGGFSWATAGWIVMAVTAIQVGYLCGVVLRGVPETATGKLQRFIHQGPKPPPFHRPL